MSNKNESAFPQDNTVSKGLSKREYIATHALAALLHNAVVNEGPDTPEYDEMMAAAAVQSADALLAELAKERDATQSELTKYQNYYSAERVTSRILAYKVEDLENDKLELWGLDSERLLAVINYYEANTGKKAQDIIKDNPNGFFKFIKD